MRQSTTANKTKAYYSASGSHYNDNSKKTNELDRLGPPVDNQNDEMELSVSQTGSRSNRLIVNDGDTVVIKSAVRSQLVFYIFFISVIAASLIISEFLNRVAVTSAAVAILIVALFVIKQFKIEILYEAS